MSWAIVTQRRKSSLPEEKFEGYFSDIRDVARRSLRRHPDPVVRSLLGMPALPKNTGGGSPIDLDVISNGYVPNKAKGNIKSTPESNAKTVQTVSTSDGLSCGAVDARCSKREKTILGFSLYFAVVVILLLAIVIVLVTNLNGANRTNDGTTNNIVNNVNGISGKTTNNQQSVTQAIKTTQKHTTHIVETTTKLTTKAATVPATDTSTGSAISSTSTPGTSTSTSLPLPLLQTPQISCSTDECLSAKQSLQRINSNVSPCGDFYSFACGAWQKENSNNTNKDYSLKSEIRLKLLDRIKGLLEEPITLGDSSGARTVKSLYKSCLASNNDGDILLGELSRRKLLDQQHTLLDPIGLRLDGTFTESLEFSQYYSMSTLGAFPLFKMSVQPRMRSGNKVKKMLQIRPPSLFLARDDYVKPLDENGVATAYVTKLADILYTYLTSFPAGGGQGLKRRKRRIVKRDGHINLNSPFGQTYLRVTDVFAFEQNLSKILPPDDLSESELSKTAKRMTIEDIQTEYNNLDWLQAFGLSELKTSVEVVYPNYFANLNILLHSAIDEILKLFSFMSAFVQGIWKYLPYPSRLKLNNVGSNSETVYSSNDCIEMTLELSENTVHAMYLERYAQDLLRRRISIDALASSAHSALRDVIPTLSWMSETTKVDVLQILARMSFQHSSAYSETNPVIDLQTTTHTFLKLAIDIYSYKYQQLIQTIGSVVTEVTLDWTQIDVIFDADLNILGIPTGLSLALDDNDPAFEIVGSIGGIISTRLMEIFFGDLYSLSSPSWWSSQTVANFDDVTSCFMQQEINNARLYEEIGNIIITNGGLQLTKQIYVQESSSQDTIIPNTSLKEEMLFYLIFTQAHCQVGSSGTVGHSNPKNIINSALRNDEKFASLFSCPLQSPMSPAAKCDLL